jgi:hypothetical protein
MSLSDVSAPPLDASGTHKLSTENVEAGQVVQRTLDP